MTPEQIGLVQSSWAALAPSAERLAELFYMRLFAMDPSLHELFRGDIAQQGRKLVKMLDTLVGALDRLDTLLPMLRELGARHREYGVRPADYDTFGQALEWTLQRVLGMELSPEAEDAWMEAYRLFADTMREPPASSAYA